MNKRITELSEYIDAISELTNSGKENGKIVVYRGENLDYQDTACVPNIYRKNVLTNNPRFEKNLFDEMKSNDLASGNNYLENAITAQHDGFPSRLLDVSFNCLVALYFACTPYYREDVSIYDGKDGKVFVFFIDKMFCPTGENIVTNYETIVNGQKDSFINNQLFAKNHKLIDHIKSNKRIIAQQGAFILFQGNYNEPLPKRICETITIDGTSKAKLRKQLNELFGINTGSIYPQVENFVDNMIARSEYVDNSSFSLENELKLIKYNIEKDIEFYINSIISDKENSHNTLYELEMNLKDYQIGIINLAKKSKEPYDNNQAEQLNNRIIESFVKDYNDLLEEEINYLNKVLFDTGNSIDPINFKLELS